MHDGLPSIIWWKRPDFAIFSVAHPSAKEPVCFALTAITIVLQVCALQELNNVDRNDRITKDWVSNALMHQLGYTIPISIILEASVAKKTFTDWMMDGWQ